MSVPRFRVFDGSRQQHTSAFLPRHRNEELYEQSTGLRDDKGQEIYEGDVLHVIEQELGDHWTGEVVWKPEVAAFAVRTHRNFRTMPKGDFSMDVLRIGRKVDARMHRSHTDAPELLQKGCQREVETPVESPPGPVTETIPPSNLPVEGPPPGSKEVFGFAGDRETLIRQLEVLLQNLKEGKLPWE